MHTNSICNNSIKQTLYRYLSQYSSIFTKPSFYLFKCLITAILSTEEVRSIKFLFDNFMSKYSGKSLNCFYNFLSYVKFPINSLMQTTVSIAVSLIPDEMKEFVTIFITTDDTLQPKFGKKFDCFFHLFDHTSKNGTAYLDGHCFVTLTISIPIFIGKKVKYLSIPIGYRLYDRIKTKLQLAAELIDAAMPLLKGYQVILLCDSWYPKGEVISAVKRYPNLELISAVRNDTALYELPPPRTGKKGRPRKYGDRIDLEKLSFEKVGDYHIAALTALSNLFDTTPIIATVSVKDVETFDSPRLFISTIASEDINIFKDHEVEDVPVKSEHLKYLPYLVYGLRWNVEVIFYEHKFFWSFSNYMVRNKNAIERYVNLIAISFCFVQVLPFTNEKYSEYKFKSPQVIKHAVAYQINEELILESFVNRLENTKIYLAVKSAVAACLGGDSVA